MSLYICKSFIWEIFYSSKSMKYNICMTYFSDLPLDNSAPVDVYALLRTQYLTAIKTKKEIENHLIGMADPGEIRFYKKKVRYMPKGSSTPRTYEYNCHYIREKIVTDDNKVRHITHFLTNSKYEEIKQQSDLYHFLSSQLEDIKNIIQRVKKMILSNFYHHPDDIPDLCEEENMAYEEIRRTEKNRNLHKTNRYAWSPEKYKCANSNNDVFMSRAELLIHDAFMHCGLTPQYETKLKIDYTVTDPDLGNVTEDSRIFYPDFKCSCNGKTYYIEYFGMMNDPEYYNDACKKIEKYIKNGIIPGYNMIALCSGDSSAIQMEPAVQVLREIVSGRNLLKRENLNSLPGIIRLDTLNNWSLPSKIKKLLIRSSQKFVQKNHKYKSSEKRIQ